MAEPAGDRPADETVAVGDRAAASVSAALRTRRSVRAFLPTPVPQEQVERLLDAASRTASNSNTQPWHVHVVTGEAKQRLTEDLWRALDAGDRAEQAGYRYQPDPAEWDEPFRARRAAFGEQLYGQTLGLEHGDTTGREEHHRRNYDFFGAPVGLILTTSRRPLDGALVDVGQLLQALMLLAREEGLDTCAQASFIDFHHVLRRHLGIGDDEVVVCGVALGHADVTHPLGTLVTPRRTVAGLATFHR